MNRKHCRRDPAPRPPAGPPPELIVTPHGASRAGKSAQSAVVPPLQLGAAARSRSFRSRGTAVLSRCRCSHSAAQDASLQSRTRRSSRRHDVALRRLAEVWVEPLPRCRSRCAPDSERVVREPQPPRRGRHRLPNDPVAAPSLRKREGQTRPRVHHGTNGRRHPSCVAARGEFAERHGDRPGPDGDIFGHSHGSHDPVSRYLNRLGARPSAAGDVERREADSTCGCPCRTAIEGETRAGTRSPDGDARFADITSTRDSPKIVDEWPCTSFTLRRDAVARVLRYVKLPADVDMPDAARPMRVATRRQHGGRFGSRVRRRSSSFNRRDAIRRKHRENLWVADGTG